MYNNNKKSRLTVFLVAICITIGGNVAASEQIQTESLVPAKIVSVQTQMHIPPGIFPIATTQDEFTSNASTEPTVLTPVHITHPTTMIALADSLSQPAVATSVDKLEDRAIQVQSGDNPTNSAGFPYAIAVVLVAFLGMVSVFRRDTRQDNSK